MHDSCGLMAKDGRKLSFSVLPRLCVHICMTQCVEEDLYAHLSSFRRCDTDLGNFEWAICLKYDRSFAPDDLICVLYHILYLLLIFQ